MTTAPEAAWVRFEALNRNFVARYWPIPNHSKSFTPIPPNATLSIPAKRAFAMNRAGDRRSYQFPYDYVNTWGLTDDGYRDVVYARASKKYCLRMIFNVEQALEDIQSDPYEAYVRLVKDAKFHSNHLEGVPDLPVPVHYGMWVMDTGDWAGIVLFSLMQYCGISWYELSFTKLNTEANRIAVGRAYEMLHDYGVDRGGLESKNEFRHVILDIYESSLTKQDLLDGKARVYITGFSEARRHRCARRLPALPLDSWLKRDEVGCAEIRTLICLLGFMVLPVVEKPIAVEALEWYDNYSKLNPIVTKAHVLVAQRQRFYPQFPPVYPLLHITIPYVDELYSRVLITRDPFDGELEKKAQQQASGHKQQAVVTVDSLPPEYKDALARNTSGHQLVVAF
ncbi:hypothetical protein R3P38DRAFT_2905110 [Favolaschia claudopus]|uniref:Uncharacterized protein n=1 Tax=Favolaschia claudopus TaxID=2862362 RepID=A0AAW0CGS6_9AGAR